MAEETPEKTRDELEYEVLLDTELPTQDYERARTDPKFLSGLVDKRVEADKGGAGSGAGDVPPATTVPPKPRGGYKKRLTKTMAKLSERDEEITRLRQERDDLKKSRTPLATPPPPAVEKEPQEEDFESHGEFVTAQSQFAARQEVKTQLDARDKKDQQAAEAGRVKTANQRVAQEIQTQTETARGNHEDFDETVAQGDHIEWTNDQRVALFRSGNLADVAYLSGLHTEEAEKLSEIKDPFRFSVALGKFLSRNPMPEPKKAETTDPPETDTPPKRDLPPPVGEQVRGGGASPKKKTRDYYMNEAPPHEYEAWRKTQKNFR